MGGGRTHKTFVFSSAEHQTIGIALNQIPKALKNDQACRNFVIVRSPFRAKNHVAVQDMARWMKCPLPPPPPNPPKPHAPRPPPPPGRRQGQGRISNITGKGFHTAVALSTASYFLFVVVVLLSTNLTSVFSQDPDAERAKRTKRSQSSSKSHSKHKGKSKK